MKKDLNIEEKCQKAIVVKPINWEQRIGKEKAQRDFAGSMMVAVSMGNLRRLTPIDSRSGRIGYVRVCDEEDCQQVQPTEYKVINYETNKDCIRIGS